MNGINVSDHKPCAARPPRMFAFRGAATLQCHDHLLVDCDLYALLVSLELLLLVETQTAGLKHHHSANVSDDEQSTATQRSSEKKS